MVLFLDSLPLLSGFLCSLRRSGSQLWASGSSHKLLCVVRRAAALPKHRALSEHTPHSLL